MYEIFIGGLETFLGPLQLLFVVAGVLIGLIVGVLPGVGPLIGIILLTPVAIQFDTVVGMSLLLAIFVGGACGGSISAILLRIPGTPLAAATLLDGWPMAQKGKAPQAVALAIAASSIGGVWGGALLMFAAPPLAQIAVKFGPPEYFSLTLIGMVCIAVVSRGSTLKGLISACLGLILACVGTDPITGDDRFTFGSVNLMGGINIVALVVGLFAISEMFMQIEKGGLNLRPAIKSFRAPFSAVFMVLKDWGNLIRSSFIGTFIGSLPAVGGVSASFISYAMTKAASKESEEFGKGHPSGIIAAESANNACCGGSLIPALALSIPGSPASAVLLGALLLAGLIPGPSLFRDHPHIVGGLFYAFMCANIFLLILGILFTPFFVSLIKVRKNRLIPFILLLSIVGTYAVQTSLFDIWCMLLFGAVGYVMRKAGFPLAPLIIARVLSPVLEPAFRRSLIISGGTFSIFVTRPLSLIILILAAIILVWSVVPPDKMKSMKMAVRNRFTRIKEKA